MKEPEITKAISECFRFCWDDHSTDTGCYPPDIEASNGRTKISYQPSSWTERSAECASQEILEMAEKENKAKSRLIEHLQAEIERKNEQVKELQVNLATAIAIAENEIQKGIKKATGVENQIMEVKDQADQIQQCIDGLGKDKH